MSRTRYILPILALSATLSLGACHKKDRKADAATPEIDVALPQVDSVIIHKSYPATLSSTDVADVVAQVNGRIIRKVYQSGSYVHAGDVLFTIDPSVYNDAVAREKAALASAESAYDYARREYEAQKEAYKSDAVAKMDLIQSESAMQQAAASVRNAKAALQTALTNLSNCTVRASINGYITSADYADGSYVAGENSPVKLATIYDEKSFNVVFNVEEGEYARILANNGGIKNPVFRKVPLKFPSALPHSYTIDMTYSAPAVDSSTGTLTLMGIVDNQNSELKEGMYCTVLLPTADVPDAILVKDASIGTDQLGSYLYVVNDSNIVTQRHISVGELYSDSLRIVTDGLKPEERYVTKALLTVRNGMKIHPRTVK